MLEKITYELTCEGCAFRMEGESAVWNSPPSFAYKHASREGHVVHLEMSFVPQDTRTLNLNLVCQAARRA